MSNECPRGSNATPWSCLHCKDLMTMEISRVGGQCITFFINCKATEEKLPLTREIKPDETDRF